MTALERSTRLLAAQPNAEQAGWERAYAKRLFATDCFIVVAVVFGSQFVRFGGDYAVLNILGKSDFSFEVTYSLVSLVLCFLWLLSLSFFNTRDHKVIGSGSVEYKRVADSTARFFGVLAIFSYLAKADFGRGYLLLALPCGLFMLLLGRWAWRKWLLRQRRAGKYMHRVVLLGHRGKTGPVASNIRRETAAGLEIVGALTPRGSRSWDLIEGVPVLGAFDEAVDVLENEGADSLVLTGADDISSRDMRKLGWDLEARGINLIVAPSVTDVAGPRIHSRPVAGLPLIYVDYPTFEGRKHLAKRAFDLAVSSALLVLLIPVFVVVAIMIKADGEGPVFFAQRRIGLNEKPFKMLKFRSMVTEAEAMLPSLLDKSEGNGVLFKMRDDPRITKVGKFLRKHSLDELPQIINVFRGEMSLVGPRPPLAREVVQYDEWAKRRLMVKPGITGLWQVNGRSRLSWSDSVRLDLFYVENWSMTGDFVILYRTFREVFSPDNAF